MYYKGKEASNNITLSGYVYPNDKRLLRFTLYKRRVDHVMVPCRITVTHGKYQEYINYYIIQR